jgi:hypothetical protein
MIGVEMRDDDGVQLIQRDPLSQSTENAEPAFNQDVVCAV